LDPLATGVLPLACGRATRLVRFLTASDKDYDATMLFGVTTDTLDVTGEETSRSGRAPSRDALVTALRAFEGEQMQAPPAYSANASAPARRSRRCAARAAATSRSTKRWTSTMWVGSVSIHRIPDPGSRIPLSKRS